MMWLEDFRQDVMFGLRTLAKSPAFTAIAVISLALGIGVNTGIFSILNGFLRPLPVRAPDELTVVAADTKGDETGLRFRVSYPAFDDLRRRQGPLADVFGYSTVLRGMDTGGKPSQIVLNPVTGNYFSALGVKPALGRLLGPGEGETSGAAVTLVLTYATWQTRFGANPAVIGRQVRLDGKTVTVIGVTEKGFRGIYAALEVEGFLPMCGLISDDYPADREVFTSRTLHPLVVLGRLPASMSLEGAQASVSAFAREESERFPVSDRGVGYRLVPEQSARPMPLRFVEDLLPAVRFFLLLLAALVLMLACMNVANILLVRATIRQKEMAIRFALGSGRARLIRQMLTESLLLALAGAVLGAVLGQWSAHSFMQSLDLATDLPLVLDVSFDWRVFAYALGAALTAAVLIGVWPALWAAKTGADSALHDGGRSNTGGGKRQRMRSLLAVGQVAGSLVLLISAGLFVRSLRSVERVELGFAPDHVLNARINPHWTGYNQQRTQDFYRELERRVKAWPEVQSASMALTVPLSLFSAGCSLYEEGRPIAADEQPPSIACNSVGPDYFDTMKIPIRDGRPFRESDTETSLPVAIVNRTMADRYWPHQNPIGKRFRTQADGPLVEVVGVTGEGKYLVLFEPPLPFFYLPMRQHFSFMQFVQLRTTVPPESLAGRLEQEIARLDPAMPVADVVTMKRSLAGAHGSLVFRIGAMQAGAMGVLGLILAMVGVYGVVSYGAAQRTREIGIRIALGATPSAILNSLLAQGAGLVLAGVVLGLAAAIVITRVLKTFLVLVSPTDPLTYAVVPAMLAVVALWACYLPARRAMQVDPMEALRHE